MVVNGRHQRMSVEEIRELMNLRGWSETRLAAELDVSQWAVRKWMVGHNKPGGPASILMRQWLEESKSAPKAKSRRAVAV